MILPNEPVVPIRIVAFDFDGVLADSVPIKDGACQYLFRHHPPGIQTAALRAWNNRKGVFRRERIQAVYQEVLGVALSETALDEQLQQFADQVLAKTVAAPWIAGVRAFLEEAQQYRYYVVSASPQEEVRTVVSRRGMDAYFKGVYGGPVKKPPLLTHILTQEACSPLAMLFIGDSLPDYLAAAAVGAMFLGVVAPGNRNVFPAVVPIVPDLTHLKQHIEA